VRLVIQVPVYVGQLRWFNHDSLAWECSSLGKRLVHGLQLEEYWMAGDAAYVYARKTLLLRSTSLRYRIRSWGRDATPLSLLIVSWVFIFSRAATFLLRASEFVKPLRYQLPPVPRTLSACMRIHNLVRGNFVNKVYHTGHRGDVGDSGGFFAWWSNAEHVRDPTMQQR
jgi:hypothetical protein